jgi:hypothetical protein
VWNAAEAARQAGYADGRRTGWKLIHDPQIEQAIQERLDQAAMAANEVLVRLTQQATVNIADFVQETVDGFALNWPVIQQRGYLIKAIKSTQYGPVLELHDGQTALIQIGKHHGLFTERQEHSGKIAIEMTLEEWQHQRAIRLSQVREIAEMLDEDD